jgi:hypothetical protein
MRAADIFYPDYDIDVEEAIGIFYGKNSSSEQDFIDSCQLLIDTGVWLLDKNIGETCLFLLESGNVFMPEENQISPDGEFVIVGTPRKNIVH